MKNLLLLVFACSTLLAHAQNTNTNTFGVGVGGFGYGSLQGFQTNLSFNYAHFYAKNLMIGVNTQFTRKTTNLSAINSFYVIDGELVNPYEAYDLYRNNTATLNIFAKYYISQKRFRPFIMAELGNEWAFNKVTYTDKNNLSRSSIQNINVAAGAGFSYFLNKKRSIALEGLYKISNPKNRQSFIPTNNGAWLQNKQPLQKEFKLGIQVFF